MSLCLIRYKDRESILAYGNVYSKEYKIKKCSAESVLNLRLNHQSYLSDKIISYNEDIVDQLPLQIENWNTRHFVPRSLRIGYHSPQ